jgi:hypothetical protein
MNAHVRVISLKNRGIIRRLTGSTIHPDSLARIDLAPFRFLFFGHEYITRTRRDEFRASSEARQLTADSLTDFQLVDYKATIQMSE